MKLFLKVIYLFFLKYVGLNLKVIISYRFLFRYFKERKIFLNKGGFITRNDMEIKDYGSNAGNAKGHYFHQDLLVAKFIHDKNPIRHVDVGSRIDGFVAHVASFRPIEVVDIRPLEVSTYDNIQFIKADLMNENISLKSVCDSLSCLHALEHFGLGRYNDPLKPNGHLIGFNNLYEMLKPRGVLYLSFPIGKNEVHFNSQRIFHPEEIKKWIVDKFKIERFDYVNDNGDLIRNSSIDQVEPLSFGCGIYTLIKVS